MTEITVEEWLAEFEKINSGGEDELYRKAVELVVKHQNSSSYILLAGLGIGLYKAKKLLARMEIEGIISTWAAGKKREVLLRKKSI